MIRTHPLRDTFFNIEQYENPPFSNVSSRPLPSRNPSDIYMSTPPDFFTSPTSDGHMDTITAITMSSRPCDVIISGSRDGVIKVFQ